MSDKTFSIVSISDTAYPLTEIVSIKLSYRLFLTNIVQFVICQVANLEIRQQQWK